MIYVHHDFYHNFTQSGLKRETEISLQLFSQEITDILLNNPNKVFGAFKICGLKYNDKWSFKEIVDAIFDNASENKKFLKAIAFLISENSGVIKGNVIDNTKSPEGNIKKQVKNGRVKQSVNPLKKKKDEVNAKSSFQRINDIEMVLEDLVAEMKSDPVQMNKAKKDTLDLLIEKSSVFPESKNRRFVPEDRGIKIIKFILVAGAIGFLLYKLYQMLPSEADLNNMGDGGKVTPDSGSGEGSGENPSSGSGDLGSGEIKEPETTIAEKQYNYDQFDYSGK